MAYLFTISVLIQTRGAQLIAGTVIRLEAQKFNMRAAGPVVADVIRYALFSAHAAESLSGLKTSLGTDYMIRSVRLVMSIWS